MSSSDIFKFRLFIADETPNSALALANLKAICRTHLTGRYEIELVDVLQEPRRALAEEIFTTPMLVKLSPGPPARVFGTLGNTETMIHALGLEPEAA